MKNTAAPIKKERSHGSSMVNQKGITNHKHSKENMKHSIIAILERMAAESQNEGVRHQMLYE